MNIVGNKDSIKALEECILGNIPVLIYGEPGIGKTSSVYMIAKKHNYKVIEINTSDTRTKEEMSKILSDVQKPSLVKKLYLFDEFDGMGRFPLIDNIITNSEYPIVMTANNINKIPKNIMNILKKKSRIIRFFPPDKKEIVNLVKEKIGNDVNFSLITNDVRNTLITFSCMSEKNINDDEIYDMVTKIFKGGKFNTNKNFWKQNNLWIWLLDNICKFYSGYDLFLAIDILTKSALYNYPNLLKSLPKSNSRKNVIFPSFFTKLKSKK